MKRAEVVGGWLGLALVVVAPVSMILINLFFADGPPLDVCGNSRRGQEFVAPLMLFIATGFVLSLMTLLGPWRPRKADLIAPTAGVCLAVPAFMVFLIAVMLTYGWEC